MKLLRNTKNFSRQELRMFSVLVALFVGSSLFFGAAASAAAAPWWTTQPSQYINPEGFAYRYSPSANMPTSQLGYYPFPSPVFCNMNYQYGGTGSYESNCIYRFPSGIISALSAASGQGQLAFGLYGNHWGACAGQGIYYGGFASAGTAAALSAQQGSQITLEWACQPMQFALQYQACGDGWWQPMVDPLYTGAYVTDSLGNTYNSQTTGTAIVDPNGPTYVDSRFGSAPDCRVTGGFPRTTTTCSANTANLVGAATITVNAAVGSTINYNLYCSKSGVNTLNATVPVLVTPPPDSCPTAVSDASGNTSGFMLSPNASKRNISATQCITNTSGNTYFIPKPARSAEFGNFVTAVSNGQVPGVSLFSR